jgi:conjugative relaxase-like TrwC/TraI family protein
MLSIGKLAAGPGAGRYYVEQVAQGRDDYYAGEGEVPGRWVGRGADLLGLRGGVTEGSISWLLGGRDPGSGALLRRPLASGAVAGFDLTFRAPKSVSILFGIAEPAVSGEVCAAHERAVGEALGYLDRQACRARRGHGGSLQVTSDGFVAAAFQHRSSRADDPLLHTHVVIANGTRGPDRRWTALDGRPLYRHAKTAGYLYQAVLRAELTERLGVRWSAVENGTADIKGVPRSVIAHFSRRRREIVEYMRDRGEHSARAAQVATLETRRRKEYGVPAERLRDEWRARAAEHGLDARRVRRLLGLVRRRPPERRRVEEMATRMLGANGLTRDRSTFTRGDVLQALAEGARDGASIPQLEAQADAVLGSDRVVALTEDGDEPRYTTGELLEVERELLDAAERHARRTDIAVPTRAALDASLDSRPTIAA